MGSRKNFTKEFKLSVIRELDFCSVAEICREHEIQKGLLYRWKHEYKINPGEAFCGNGKMWKEEAKIAQYERLVGRLYSEIDLLKKSIEKSNQLKAEEQRKRQLTK